MTYEQLALLHLATVLPAFVAGTFLLVRRKGTTGHRAIGRVYMVLMLATAVVTLLMPARSGPTLFGHFGPLHAFSLLTAWNVPAAWLAARRGDVRTHRGNMIVLYAGGLVIAGAFALAPGRMLHGWLFG